MDVTQHKYSARCAKSFDIESGQPQTGRIAGHVTKLNAPITLPCLVFLNERTSMHNMASVMTDATGFFVFEHVNRRFYYALIATDTARQYNAVIQDMVTPL